MREYISVEAQILFLFCFVKVSEKVARDWCASRGNIPYFETSAKEGYNVDAAFLCIAQTALAADQHDQDM